MSTDISPEMITSTGNFCSLLRLDFVIFFDTAIIVGTSLDVCNILEFEGMLPLESRIIRIGFFHVYDVQLAKDYLALQYFFQLEFHPF